jgi:hypothetical protein
MLILLIRASELVLALRFKKYLKAYLSLIKILGVVKIIKALLNSYIR